MSNFPSPSGSPSPEFRNRIVDHLCNCGRRPPRPAEPSIADRLLANADRLKLEVWRLRDGETELSYEIHGSLNTGGDSLPDGTVIDQEHTPADLRRLATSLLGQFTAKREGGGE